MRHTDPSPALEDSQPLPSAMHTLSVILTSEQAYRLNQTAKLANMTLGDYVQRRVLFVAK